MTVGLDLALPPPVAKRALRNAQVACSFLDPKVISEVVHFIAPSSTLSNLAKLCNRLKVMGKIAGPPHSAELSNRTRRWARATNPPRR